LRRDRLIILAGLVSIVAFAWAYLLHLTFAMGTMEMAMDMAISMQTWTVMDLVLLFVMWTVMMVAMMVPTATAMILAFAALNRRRRARATLCPYGNLSGRVCGGVDRFQCPGHPGPVGTPHGGAPLAYDGQ
jgi:predicted metal-binding membrane protein